MTIRDATEADLPRIVEMARVFVETTPYRELIVLDAAYVAALARHLLTLDDVAVLVADTGDSVVGMIAMMIFLHPMSGDCVGSEIVWWMDPAYRGSAGMRLLRAGEAWAKDHGAVLLQLIAPTPKVERFYEAVGYTPVERNYQRRIA